MRYRPSIQKALDPLEKNGVHDRHRPEWVHTRQYGVTTNSIAAEAVLDFMYWPSGKHRLGWFIEPGYEYNFGRGHERSIGASGGLLIAIRRGL
jgi:hypothetical protein